MTRPSFPDEVRARLQALGQAAEAEMAQWLATRRRPDEHPAEARRRYAAEKSAARAAQLRWLVDHRPSRRRSPVEPAAQKEDRVVMHTLTDDGEEDALWALDHSQRRYRVRPLRAADNAWWVDDRGAVVVFDVHTIDRIVAPVCALPFPVEDTDACGAALFSMRDDWNSKNGGLTH